MVVRQVQQLQSSEREHLHHREEEGVMVSVPNAAELVI
jgi:hypothetical protein